MTRTTAFDLMLGELADKLSPAAMAQAHAVFAGWAGQRIDIPTSRTLRARNAEQAARAALSAGATRPQVVERLKGMGLRRAAAYKLAQRVQEGRAMPSMRSELFETERAIDALIVALEQRIGRTVRCIDLDSIDHTTLGEELPRAIRSVRVVLDDQEGGVGNGAA